MSHHTWNYQAALREAGYRVTPQREVIMDVICDAGRRLTAQEVCDAVRERAPATNPATVYRNLHFLTDRKLLRVIERQGRSLYVLGGPSKPHHHLACRVCGAETEIPGRTTEALFATLLRDYGFDVEDDHLVLHGTCAACREA